MNITPQDYAVKSTIYTKVICHSQSITVSQSTQMHRNRRILVIVTLRLTDIFSPVTLQLPLP